MDIGIVRLIARVAIREEVRKQPLQKKTSDIDTGWKIQENTC
jgi:hypothetical protein